MAPCMAGNLRHRVHAPLKGTEPLYNLPSAAPTRPSKRMLTRCHTRRLLYIIADIHQANSRAARDWEYMAPCMARKPLHGAAHKGWGGFSQLTVIHIKMKGWAGGQGCEWHHGHTVGPDISTASGGAAGWGMTTTGRAWCPLLGVPACGCCSAVRCHRNCGMHRLTGKIIMVESLQGLVPSVSEFCCAALRFMANRCSLGYGR